MKGPNPLLVKVTVPVGVIGVPGELSLTVAVHVVDVLNGIVAGLQPTAVVVLRFVTDTLKAPELV